MIRICYIGKIIYAKTQYFHFVMQNTYGGYYQPIDAEWPIWFYSMQVYLRYTRISCIVKDIVEFSAQGFLCFGRCIHIYDFFIEKIIGAYVIHSRYMVFMPVGEDDGI